MCEFNHQSVSVFTSQEMERVARKGPGGRGWAHYPPGFFGKWQANSCVARASMNKPKQVVWVDGVGWVFDIESRIAKSASSHTPVGVVYTSADLDSSERAAETPGTVGYLATTKTKRVRVVYKS